MSKANAFYTVFAIFSVSSRLFGWEAVSEQKMRPPCKLIARYILFSVSLMGYLVITYLLGNEPFGGNRTNDSLPPGFVNDYLDEEKSPGSRDELRELTFSSKISVEPSVFKNKAIKHNEMLSPTIRVGGRVNNNYVLSSDIRLNQQAGKNIPDNTYFECSNIHLIRLRKKVGEGVSKETHLGEYKGDQVAVKMVTRHQADVKKCLRKYQNDLPLGTKMNISQKASCYIFPTMKLMKETLILQQLNHPGIVKLLGFCVRSEESETSDLSEHGVIVIEEYGSRFMLSTLQVLPWQKRLELARDLASLLLYLQRSPLGSLIVPDFKEEHFLMKNGKIKLTDFDDVNSVEPSCLDNLESLNESSLFTRSRSVCDFNLPCQMGLCVGTNAKYNLQNMRNLFFKRLLTGSFPDEISDDIVDINIKLDSLSINAEQLYHRLSIILQFIPRVDVVS